jgi:hypothetical protein
MGCHAFSVAGQYSNFVFLILFLYGKNSTLAAHDSGVGVHYSLYGTDISPSATTLLQCITCRVQGALFRSLAFYRLT